MGEDERLLLDYSRRGEASSLTALVERNSIWMTAFLRGMLRSDSDADDVLQQAWLRVIKSRRSYRGGSARAYLAKTVRTAALDFLRKKSRYVLAADDGDAILGAEVADSTTPADVFESNATAADVREAVLNILSDSERQIVLLRVEGELSFREIAEDLDLPLGTVLTRMRTATSKLKKKLGGTGK